MIKNFVPSRRVEYKEYRIEFLRKDGSGYSFRCDRNGVLEDEEKTKQSKGWIYCITHEDEFDIFNQFTEFDCHYTEPAHGTCICGEEVELYNQYYGSCQCPKCGRWYNLFGQSLVPPHEWEIDPSEFEFLYPSEDDFIEE